MKRFRRSLLARVVARILIYFLALPAFVYGSGPALAQTSGQPATGANSFGPRYVAVLDFQDDSHSNYPGIGRDAADAVASAITGQRSASFDWQIVPRSDVQNAMLQAHVAPPLDNVAIQRLARILREREPVDYFLTGKVRRVSVDQRSHTATVGIETLVYDANTGDLINGAYLTRTSTAVAGAQPDLLINQALEGAAFETAQRLSQYTLPTGIVLSSAQGEADISLGQTAGIVPGEEFIVTRGTPPNSQYVGRLKVLDVSPDQARTEILDNRLGIGSNDLVQAVLTLPAIEHPTTRRVPSGPHMNPWSVLIALAGLGAALSLVNNNSKGPLAAPTSVTAVATQVGGNAAVRVTWSDNAPFPVYTQVPTVTGSALVQNVLEYNIYRTQGGFKEPAGCTGPNENTFVDLSQYPVIGYTLSCQFLQPFFNTNNNNTTPTTTGGTTGATIGGTIGGTTGTNRSRARQVGATGTTGTIGTTGGTAGGTTTITIYPLIPGTHYFYLVSRVVSSTPGALLASQGTTATATTGGFGGGGGLAGGGGFTGGAGGFGAGGGGFGAGGGGFGAGGGGFGAGGGGFGGGFRSRGREISGSSRPPAPSSRTFHPSIGGRQLGITSSTGGGGFTNSGGGGGLNTSSTTSSTTTGGAGGYIESFFSHPAGPVTPIDAPTLTQPASFSQNQTPVDLTVFAAAFSGTRGANEYQVQVSTSPDFTSGTTYFSPIIVRPETFTGEIDLPPSDLTTTFPTSILGQGQTYQLYVRVGARNSQDAVLPIPRPQDSLSLPRQYRWIYSDIALIQSLPAPPGAPGGGGGGGGGVGGPPPPPGNPRHVR